MKCAYFNYNNYQKQTTISWNYAKKRLSLLNLLANFHRFSRLGSKAKPCEPALSMTVFALEAANAYLVLSFTGKPAQSKYNLAKNAKMLPFKVKLRFI